MLEAMIGGYVLYPTPKSYTTGFGWFGLAAQLGTELTTRSIYRKFSFSVSLSIKCRLSTIS